MKKYLITGLLIWIPLVITLWVLKVVVDVLDQSLLLLPATFQTESWLGVHIPGLGVILAVNDIAARNAVVPALHGPHFDQILDFFDSDQLFGAGDDARDHFLGDLSNFPVAEVIQRLSRRGVPVGAEGLLDSALDPLPAELDDLAVALLDHRRRTAVALQFVGGSR